MAKIPSLLLQIEIWARCLGGCIFPVPEGNYIFFFQFIFWYILESTILAYALKLGEKDSVYDYFYLSKRVSIFSRYGFFCCTFIYLAPFGVIENRVIKINFKYFNGNYEYSSCPGWSILFLYAPAQKDLAFLKKLSLS